ncbi:O-antigen ligase family protein [Mycolicibacterium litorale]|uniref:O-antigen ligase-related domain-containing protein n=1 Tax=Mycolicibacterium litorale TaxID=758802 RepID=A0AAD1IP72_9MYCO|nr:O-antigen ligase family protein [Mycolicibacterium litorale]MCV7418118.1 O-antigen ligase family protein [Mycolicibacterium litorale]TDY06495.1 O-antigen ligase-like membrane protein [Mycolicibacterium litorale]BBY19360.1 hypothetical protein MLIT_49520 [Mycolicibacterium litorale]
MIGALEAPGSDHPRVTPGQLSRCMGAACAAAAGFGVLFPVAPGAAIEVLVLIPLAFATPVAALSVLVLITALVPFELQDDLAVVGGRDQPGLLFVDALLVLGLLRVLWLLMRRRLEFDLPLIVGSIALLICCAALGWGVAQGGALSEAGHEARRVVMAVGAFILAWPLMADRSTRRRMIRMLLVLGLALPLWGLAQWMFEIGYVSSGDAGVRMGNDLVVGSRGMLQGGMFGYPLAITFAWAALLSGRVRTSAGQALLGGILILNAVCLVLTYERTMWLVTVLQCVVVVVIYGAAAIGPAVRWGAMGLGALVCLSMAAPGEALMAVKRLMTVSEVSTDRSYSYRVIESEAAIDEITARPVTGSGLGATITWESHGVFAPMMTSFIHNGYLWLAWKFGVPVAALVVLIMVSAIMRRTHHDGDWRWSTVSVASRASLAGLVLIPITFPVFNVLGVTPLLGFFLAVCFARRPAEPPQSMRCDR